MGGFLLPVVRGDCPPHSRFTGRVMVAVKCGVSLRPAASARHSAFAGATSVSLGRVKTAVVLGVAQAILIQALAHLQCGKG